MKKSQGFLNKKGMEEREERKQSNGMLFFAL
jgi:hypothetical protein